jgi:hypothetical protein
VLRSLRLAPVVAATAARVYVRGLRVVVPVAAVVFGATDLAQRVIGDWLDHPLQNADPGGVAFVVALLAVVLASSLFAEVLFAGLLDRIVEADLARRPAPTIRDLAAGLPYGRLIVADALVVGLGVLGLVLFVLPGLAAITLLALAGPLVIAEGLGPWRAARRSFQLLRRRPAAAVALVLVPTLAVTWVEDLVSTAVEHWPAVTAVAAEVAVNATLAAFAGLLLAVLARRLVSEPG